MTPEVEELLRAAIVNKSLMIRYSPGKAGSPSRIFVALEKPLRADRNGQLGVPEARRGPGRSEMRMQGYSQNTLA